MLFSPDVVRNGLDGVLLEAGHFPHDVEEALPAHCGFVGDVEAVALYGGGRVAEGGADDGLGAEVDGCQLARHLEDWSAAHLEASLDDEVEEVVVVGGAGAAVAGDAAGAVDGDGDAAVVGDPRELLG